MSSRSSAADDTEQRAPWKVVAGLVVGLGVVLAVWWPFGGGHTDTRVLPPRYPTTGSVSYNGKPLHGAVITFWPLPGGPADW